MKFAWTAGLVAAIGLFSAPLLADLRYTLAVIPPGKRAGGAVLGIDASPKKSPLIITEYRSDHRQRQDITIQTAGETLTETRILLCDRQLFLRIDPQLKIYCQTPLPSTRTSQVLDLLLPGLCAPSAAAPSGMEATSAIVTMLVVKDEGVHTIPSIELPAHRFEIAVGTNVGGAAAGEQALDVWISDIVTGPPLPLPGLLQTSRSIVDSDTGAASVDTLAGDTTPVKLLCSQMPVEVTVKSNSRRKMALMLTGFLPGDIDPEAFSHPAQFTEVSAREYEAKRVAYIASGVLSRFAGSPLLEFIGLAHSQIPALANAAPPASSADAPPASGAVG